MTLLNFGQYLQCKREALTLSQSEASRRMKVSQTALHGWENNKWFPKGKRLEIITKFYNLTQEELKMYDLTKVKEKSITTGETIAGLMKYIERLSCKIEKAMDGESNFEKNMKNKALNQLEAARYLLQDVLIVDEALHD